VELKPWGVELKPWARRRNPNLAVSRNIKANADALVPNHLERHPNRPVSVSGVRARDRSGNPGANRAAVCEELERIARFPAQPEMRPILSFEFYLTAAAFILTA
jgi:hypothetical protein